MSRPLIYLLIALIAGIIAGSFFAFSYYLLSAVLTLILFFLFVTIRNHRYKTPKQALETDSAAPRPACAGFYFRNWSFTNKWSTASFFLIISFIFVLGVFDIQKQNYFIEDERNIVQYIDKVMVTVEGIVIESPPSLGKVSFQLTSDTK
jgi:hypothetical protein